MADHGAGASSSAAAAGGGSASPSRPAPPLDPSVVRELLDDEVPPQIAANISTQEVDAYVSSLGAEINREPAAELLDTVINTDVSRVVMSPEEMEEVVPHQQVVNDEEVIRTIMEEGNFVEWVLDTVVKANRWLDVVGYLGNLVRCHATESVVPVPAGTPLEVVHAQLFLSPHGAYVYELIAGGDRDTAQRHFDQHMAPLRESCANGYVRNLYHKVDLTITGLNEVPEDAANQAAIEIKDYIFLYFPNLKPKLEKVRGREPNPLWAFGEQLRRADGVCGYRCFSCHKVVWRNMGSTHLRFHLEVAGGKARCPAVAQCTLDRLAAIPRPQ